MKLTNHLMYFLLFLTFTLAPIDIAFNVKVLGFNVRTGLIVMILLTTLLATLVTKDIILRKTKIQIPLYLALLIVAGIINIAFVPNSVYIPRGLIYALTLLLFTFLIFFMTNTKNYISLEKVINLYLLSFLIHVTLGIVQFILYYTFGINFFMSQPGRINGLTYEPSYYVTYLTPGTILATLIALFTNNEKGRTIFYALIASSTLLTLLFSTSKLGIIESLIAVFLGAVIGITLKTFKILENVNLKKNLSYLILFVLIFLGIFWSSINKDTILSVIIPNENQLKNLYTNKLKEVISSSKESSFDIRLSQFKETLNIALENPLIGKSLGGVAPYRALKHGIIPRNNQEIKPFEGINIFAEMLAGLGIIGFVTMLGFITLISYEGIRLSIKILSSDLNTAITLLGLTLGFLLELLFLAFNQNILRLYLWNHIAVLALAIEKLREKQ